MKILIAGATGAIGQPLLKLLKPLNHSVYAITHSEEKGALLSKTGAEPIIADILDKPRILSHIEKIKPDVIIDMLTSLPGEYTPAAMQAAAERDAKIRWEGGGNLVEGALKNGVRRYISLSAAFWYAPGIGLAHESEPFAFNGSPGVAAGSRIYADLENRILSSKMEAVPLRFGFFYGPGTWFHADGNMAEQIKNQKFPLIGKGEGVWNFIHIEDAAGAVILALTSPTGPYNIVNDYPSPLFEWLYAFARTIKAPAPPVISEQEGEKLFGADSVYYATKLRGASNSRATEILGFEPRRMEWFLTKEIINS